MADQPNFLEVLSPAFIGSKRLTVRLSDQTPVPRALQDVRVEFDYSGADAYGGIVLPVSVTVQAPDPKNYRVQTFRRVAPRSFVFNPPEKGIYLVTVKEVFHNQLHGALQIEVIGEQPIPGGVV